MIVYYWDLSGSGSGSGVSASPFRGCNWDESHACKVLLTQYLTVSAATQKKGAYYMHPTGMESWKLNNWGLSSLYLGKRNATNCMLVSFTHTNISESASIMQSNRKCNALTNLMKYFGSNCCTYLFRKTQEK